VRRIARLARIKVTDAEAKALEAELSGILDWVKQLDEVDTKNVEPMSSVTPMRLKMRADKVGDGEIADDILANAPVREDHFFVVPKVVVMMGLISPVGRARYRQQPSRNPLPTRGGGTQTVPH
jgi:aspartyl-tRNA(Asn)/glutamyl-tRNA(Gln) amidotransferase subunit C